MALLMMSRKVNENDTEQGLGDCLNADATKARHPVDLVHLSRQTLGDRSLEKEILALFKNQSTLYLQRLDEANDKQQRYMAAHTILGSARGIGAWQVAAAARVIEMQCEYACDMSKIRHEVGEVNSYITELLNDEAMAPTHLC